jgi:hypothetical protein
MGKTPFILKEVKACGIIRRVKIPSRGGTFLNAKYSGLKPRTLFERRRNSLVPRKPHVFKATFRGSPQQDPKIP